MSKKPVQKGNEVETTGHSWDGIEEYNNPLPKWWVYIFYACIVWGIGYTIAYPAWPGLKDSTAGLIGFSTRGDVAKDIAEHQEKLGPINAKLEAAELTALAKPLDEMSAAEQELHGYAVSAGAAVFKTWCAQCHGSGAAGAEGYPNLLDNDWLWGGDIEAIHATISHGIRNEDDPAARYSEMPAFGDDYLEPEEIEAVVNYTMTLSGQEPNDASLVEAGKEVFEYECTACHAEDGTGDRMQGAPNLTDAIWLYGGDYDAIKETVTYSRFGVMPPWSKDASEAGRLTEAQIRAVSVYVHQLGGGE